MTWRATEDLTLGFHGGGSTEYDYTSFGFGGSASLDLFEKNTTLSIGVNTYIDQVDIIRWNGSQAEGTDDRLSVTTASWKPRSTRSCSRTRATRSTRTSTTWPAAWR